MNEIITIIGVSFAIGIVCIIGVLIGAFIGTEWSVTKKAVLGYFFGASAGAAFALSIYVYVLDLNEIVMGFVPGTAFFCALILAEYLETGDVMTKTILKALGFLAGFTLAGVVVYITMHV